MFKSRISSIIAIPLILIVALCFISVFKSLKNYTPPQLTVIGAVLMADGIGSQAAELINALKDDIDVGFKKGNGHFAIKGTSQGIQSILKNRKRPLGKVIVYEDCLGFGESFQGVIKGPKNEQSIRIAYSMFESSEIPPEWVNSLNTYFDAVAVPDKFFMDVYKNSGVTIPIFELPLGLNLNRFLTAPLKTQKHSPMVFANLGSAIPRKNQLKLIQAFHQAFGNSPDVKLRINCRFGDEQVIQDMQDEIAKLQASNIEFTIRELNADVYFKTLENTDCYVNISSGEGFSIQPRQAMALGMPTITTDNTAQSTICQSHLGCAVPSLNLIPAFYPDLHNCYGSFYDCNVEDVAAAFRDVYDNYDHYLGQNLAARAWASQYSYNQLKPLYLGIIAPKKIVLGNINKITPDCLYMDSEVLCEKFSKLLEIPWSYANDG